MVAGLNSKGKFGGCISIGGGSVIDTYKISNVLATCLDDLMAFVNALMGQVRKKIRFLI